MTPSFLALFITPLFELYHGFARGMSRKIMEPQEKFLSSRLNLLLIESETEELEQTNISLISESLRIQSFVDEHIISTLTIEYFSFRQIEDQLFCKFIKTQTYFITCIKVIDYYGNHRLNQLNEQSIISIELNELKGIECHEFSSIQNHNLYQFVFIIFICRYTAQIKTTK